MAEVRVLIIEDNPANLQLAEFLLKAGGFQVDTATTAPEGIAKARATAPALVLMDVQLPGMDGLTATRQLKDDPTLAHIPVVALTAYAMRGDRERCLAAGCTGYITKPINVKDFVRAVTAYLETQT